MTYGDIESRPPQYFYLHHFHHLFQMSLVEKSKGHERTVEFDALFHHISHFQIVRKEKKRGKCVFGEKIFKTEVAETFLQEQFTRSLS